MADENKKKEASPEAAKIEALEAIVETLNARIEKLESDKEPTPKKKAEPVKKPEIPEGTFKCDEKEYKFLLPVFRIGNEKYTAEQVMKDKELQAMLVEKKLFGIIEAV